MKGGAFVGGKGSLDLLEGRGKGRNVWGEGIALGFVVGKRRGQG